MTHDLSTLMAKVLRDHEASLPTACCYLTMLSLCQTREEMRFVDQARWSELTIESTYGELRKFSRKTGRGINLFHLECDGEKLALGKQMIPGLAEHRDSVLIVPAVRGSALHILPLGRPMEHVEIPAPAQMRPEDAPRAPEGAEPAERVEVPAAAGANAPAGRREAAAPPAPVQRVRPARARGEFYGRVELENGVPRQGPVRYQGVWAPFRGWRWDAGWWPSTAPRDAEERQYLLVPPLPDVCSATIGMVKKHREMPLYLPVGKDVPPPLSLLPQSQLADGQGRMESTFAEGDTVLIDGVPHKAVAVQKFGASLLRLINVEYGFGARGSRFVRSALGRLSSQLLSAKSAQVLRAGVPQLKGESVRQAEWIAAVHSSVDPLETSILQRLRQDAAAARYSDSVERADDCVRYAQTLRKVYPGLNSVCGRFGWGYCYSCGAELPGKFKGRLCVRCLKRNSCSLASAVAEGAKVCSMANPVLYPGVVHTETQHPALKAGLKTLATPENFRLAPSGSRPLWPPPHSGASARAWAGWA